MALESIIFQQDPFIYEYNYDMGGSPPSSSLAWNPSSSNSPEINHDGDSSSSRRKRRRTKPLKNKEEMENQRMTHIAVERNRRRQMNDYLAILRSLMPPSYSQRGDQASIVGGAINFVKELEQLNQFLEAQKQQRLKNYDKSSCPNPILFSSDFLTFPQYSTSPTPTPTPSGIANIEVMMVESHANIKLISTKRRPRQLLKLVAGFQSLFLTILHLNITTLHQSLILYSFSVKVEEECDLSTVNEIARSVHDIMGMIEEECIN